MLKLILQNKKKLVIFSSFSLFLFSGCLTIFSNINVTNPDFLKNAGVKKDFNPHEGEHCNVCHKASIEVLNSASQSKRDVLARRSMQTDLVRLCDDCHEASKWPHHLTGIKPRINLINLPLDSEGLITCATTCHNVHTTDPALLKGKILDSFDDLCLSCHNKGS